MLIITGTARLTVNVSSTGHFVFRNTDGNNINALYLKPNDKGTVILHNTGQDNITGFTLTSKSSTIISQSSSTCFSANTLKNGSSCTIDYAVPTAVSATTKTFTLTATGTNADNNGTELPVTVSKSKEANLVFRNLSGQVITHLDLNVGQNTGTILLQNTGGTAVTNLTQKGLPPATMGTCFLKFGGTYLGPGSSCSMNYGPLTTFFPVTLTATGYISGRSVTTTLTISVIDKGHFAFSKDGQDIAQLRLKPGDSGTFTIQNTGTINISDFWVKQLPSTTGSILNNSGASASPCPLNQNAKKTLTAKKSCEVGYKISSNADPEHLTLSPLGYGADNSGTAMLKINIISKLGHAIFRQNKQQITHLDLKPGDKTAFELYNAGGATITDLRLLGLPPNMTFNSTCSGQPASLPAGNNCTTTYQVLSGAKRNTFTLTATGNPSSIDNRGSAVLTINIIPANTGHFVFLNDQGQHIDSLYLQPGDSGSIKLHNAVNTKITDVRLQGVSPNIYMNCPNTHVTQNELQDLNKNKTNVEHYNFMYQTRDGTIYVGTTNEGLKKFNAARNDLVQVDTTDVSVGFIYQTRDGTIYVGTDKGLKKLKTDGTGLEKINDTLDNINFSSGFMYQTRDGTIYVGAWLYNLKKFNAARNGLEFVTIQSTFIYQTRDGTIYVEIIGYGFKKFNPARNSFEFVQTRKKNTQKINVGSGFMYQTRDGTIYVGTQYNGLYKLNAARNDLVRVAKTSVLNGFMYQTRDGTIYVGTANDGLKKLKADGTGLEKINDTLDAINVKKGFMYQTLDGTIYVGTYDQGLKKLLYTVKRTLTQASDANSDCTINYFIPKGITIKKTSVLTAYGKNADNSGTAALPVTISPEDSQGHFVFENGNGKSITNLDLKPGDSGMVLLRNVGKADILNVKRDGLLAPDPLHFVSKCLPSGQNQPLISLKSGDSCTFFYRVKNKSPNTKFALSPTGIGC